MFNQVSNLHELTHAESTHETIQTNKPSYECGVCKKKFIRV